MKAILNDINRVFIHLMHIGAIPTEGIPCLLKVLLPSNCAGLPAL